jgi:surface antigen
MYKITSRAASADQQADPRSRRGRGTLRRVPGVVFAALSSMLALAILAAPGVAHAATLPVGDLGPALGGTERTMWPGQYLQSANGVYRLVMQGDGNLVLYSGAKALWDSQTSTPRAYATLQAGDGADGNLVIYSPAGTALWTAHVPTSPHDRLEMQNDGNLVVYDTSGNAQWATMSAVEPRGATLTYNPGGSGQCTWWVEQQFHAYTGAYINTLGINGTNGNALNWGYNASHRGWSVGPVPRIGSIAVFQAGAGGSGSVGHVAWVTQVYPARNAIVVSEMNVKGLGVTDTRTISPAFAVNGLQYIYSNPV